MSRDILLSQVDPDPEQPRKHFDQTQLDELAQSMAPQERKGRGVAKLRVREIAEQKGLDMSELQRLSGLAMGVIRRYWHSTANGLADGDPLEEVSHDYILKMAEVLHVPPGELLGNRRHRRR